MKKIFCITLTTALCLFLLLAGCNRMPATNTVPSSSDAISPTDIAQNDAADTVQEDPHRIELGGDASEEFVAESNCYAEGERVVIFFQKGCTVRGDMLKIAEMVMTDIEKETGLSFDKNYEPSDGYAGFSHLYEMEDLDDINADHEKVNIYIVDFGPYIQRTIDNSIIVESADFDYEETSYQTLYHELAHVIHLRNGVSLGGTLTEGYAVYVAYETQKKNNMPQWSMVQFYGNNNLFDDSIISKGEDGFQHMYDDNNYDYQYGIRFVTFLFDVYGDNAFYAILDDATSRGYSDSYSVNDPSEKDTDNQQLISIIKWNTSDDVFDEFADWYSDNWDIKRQEYENYMRSLGIEM